MTDIQNNNAAWNEWANYVLEISKRHDIQIDELYDKINKSSLDIENMRELKLSNKEFSAFMISDYVVFKTEILTKAKEEAKNQGMIWGGVISILVGLIGLLIRNILKL